MEFKERSLIETGFAPVFDAEVRPKLMALEGQRQTRLKRAYRNIAIAVAVTGALFAGIAAIWGEDAFFGYVFVGMIGVMGALVAWAVESSSWNSSVEDAVMPAICAHVGDIAFDSSGGSFDLGKMRQLGLLPSYDSASLEDKISGTRNGTEFAMVQATLSRRSSSSSNNSSKKRTVFGGLLFEIAVPVESPGRIVLMRDRGGLGNMLGEALSFGGTRSMPKVDFDHAAFEAAFEVYADQPAAARDFMPPAFLDALLDIGEDHGGRKGAKALVAGFVGHSFFMALRRGGHFMRMGRLTVAVTDMEEDLHGIFDDIALSHQIIDRLHGA